MPNALIDTSTDGASLVASPGTDKFIRVHGWDVTADGQVTVTLKSDTTVRWKTYACNDANVKGGIVKDYNPDGWFDCAVGVALKLGLSSAVAAAGSVNYSVHQAA